MDCCKGVNDLGVVSEISERKRNFPALSVIGSKVKGRILFYFFSFDIFNLLFQTMPLHSTVFWVQIADVIYLIAGIPDIKII